MNIAMTSEGNVAVFALSGQLDAVTAPELEARLGTWLRNPGPGLVLDLEALEYISSAGLRVLLMTAKKMKAANGRFCLARLGIRVKDAYLISGFDHIIKAFDTMEEALAASR